MKRKEKFVRWKFFYIKPVTFHSLCSISHFLNLGKGRYDRPFIQNPRYEFFYVTLWYMEDGIPATESEIIYMCIKLNSIQN